MNRWLFWLTVSVFINIGLALKTTNADEFQLQLRGASESPIPVTWKADRTAVIVCDVWDYHHCLNAFNRLGEMLPRMNELLVAARQRGAIVIHAPSDCMPFYESHPARKRAADVPKTDLPQDIASWCSRAPSEEASQSIVYPLDQSDGGEDDDPEAHKQWSAKLQSLGRNPAMPWKAQSPGIQIDSDEDYISDRGDEVWNILRSRGIQHVLMVGVHTNMCVLGRPFGLRRLVKQKMQVALVRDMTDCMYNPKRWPYVDHFSGNDLLMEYTQKYVCPTITSDQILGGKPFRFEHDNRMDRGAPTISVANKEWNTITIAEDGKLTDIYQSLKAKSTTIGWLRCSLRFPQGTLDSRATLAVKRPAIAAWLNGKALPVLPSTVNDPVIFQIDKSSTFGNDDANLLVIKLDSKIYATNSIAAPLLTSRSSAQELAGKWEVRFGTDEAFSNIPLPAKFGMSPEVFYTVR